MEKGLEQLKWFIELKCGGDSEGDVSVVDVCATLTVYEGNCRGASTVDTILTGLTSPTLVAPVIRLIN